MKTPRIATNIRHDTTIAHIAPAEVWWPGIGGTGDGGIGGIGGTGGTGGFTGGSHSTWIQNVECFVICKRKKAFIALKRWNAHYATCLVNWTFIILEKGKKHF